MKIQRNQRFAATLAILSLSFATAAFAGGNGNGNGNGPGFQLGSSICALSDISPTATGCRGWFAGNMNSGNGDAKDASAAALNDLLGVNTFAGGTLTWLENFNTANTTIDFATALFGQTVVAFHVGAANGQANGVGYQASALYVFDAGNVVGGLNTFNFNRAGLSNARLYSTGSYVDPCANPMTPGCGGGGNSVPEPGTWALMIVGFGSAGAMLRRRRALVA